MTKHIPFVSSSLAGGVEALQYAKRNKQDVSFIKIADHGNSLLLAMCSRATMQNQRIVRVPSLIHEPRRSNSLTDSVSSRIKKAFTFPFVTCCWRAVARRSNMPKQTNKMSVSSIAYHGYSFCPFLTPYCMTSPPSSSPMHIRSTTDWAYPGLVVS